MYFHDSLIFNSLASKSIAKFYVGSHYMKVFAKIRLLFHKPLHLSHQLLNSLLLPNQFRKLSSSRNFLPFYIHAFTKMDLQDSHKLYKPGELPYQLEKLILILKIYFRCLCILYHVLNSINVLPFVDTIFDLFKLFCFLYLIILGKQVLILQDLLLILRKEEKLCRC